MKREFTVDPEPRDSGNLVKDEVPPVKGGVTITIRNVKTGEVREKVTLENVVVDNLRSQEVFLLAGSFLPVPPADITRFIDTIAFGTSGTAETSSDTTITNETAVTVSSVSYPTSNSVKFSGTLAAGSGNGKTFREVGLKFQAPSPFLAARRTFDPMTKSSTWSWEIDWTLTLG